MYSFGRDKNIILNLNHINNGDYVCFCFGEIDCRAHINKYEINWQETINNLVAEYFIAISTNVYGLNVKTCVYNAVPQIDRRKPENLWINKWDEESSTLPAIGTDEDRHKYTLYMNKKLKEFCDLYGYFFFDVYNKYVDKDGFLNSIYSDGNCHIKDPVFIKEHLEKIIYG
jgi:hypothetical protein